jgi:endonuclease YncB( thermonuclease family)
MALNKTFPIVAIIVFIFAILSLFPAAHAVIRTVEGTVDKVLDGDSLRVVTDQGTELKILLYGCDAPEKEKRNKKNGAIIRPGQPYSEEATQALKAKVKDKNVRIDIINIDHKQYVAIIWRKKRNINLEMVREGYAEASWELLKQPYYAKFLDAEQAAKFRKKGIWGLPKYERPCDFRRRMKIPQN